MSDWQLDKEAYELLLERINDIRVAVREQNGRVGKLEAWRNRLIGAWGIVAALLVWLADKIL